MSKNKNKKAAPAADASNTNDATAPVAAPVTETTAAEKRAATVASKRATRIAARGYALPLVLTCKVTGKQVKYTSPTYIEKVIGTYGSLENLQSNFVSRDGKRQTKETAAAAAPATAEAPQA
jgi:hypothetical protein